tara:strand:+ start:198997 stop:199818 length:822 start_codon:yes stop_codon:yes gene_type:complete
MVTILDGPLGTELDARGVSTRLPLWSAAAIDSAPEVIAEIHRDYAAAGATVHTANTFRTKRRTVGDRWETMARAAVRIVRESVPVDHRVAGSIAPLEDCYRPDLSPSDPRPEHRELAKVLADSGCDILLCETFPHAGEAAIAVEEAVRTGVETWLALTAGPSGDLLSAEQMSAAASVAIDCGATAVLVNCTPAQVTLPFVRRLADDHPGVPIGAYANAGDVDDQVGWASDPSLGADKYLAFARSWSEAGSVLIGGCCGTGPAHIAAVARKFLP